VTPEEPVAPAGPAGPATPAGPAGPTIEVGTVNSFFSPVRHLARTVNLLVDETQTYCVPAATAGETVANTKPSPATPAKTAKDNFEVFCICSPQNNYLIKMFCPSGGIFSYAPLKQGRDS
jgi:hypothetical protein